jgi:hypothetical protein
MNKKNLVDICMKVPQLLLNPIDMQPTLSCTNYVRFIKESEIFYLFQLMKLADKTVY